MTRLASSIVVSGLLRAAEACGGNGVVLAKGDASAGAIFTIITHRGGDPIMLERVSTLTNSFTWNRRKRAESTTSEEVARLVAQMKRFDSDLWVIELDVPNAEQFIVDFLSER